MRVTVELPDHLVAEIEGRMPDITWSRLITDCLEYALAMADSERTTGRSHPTTQRRTTPVITVPTQRPQR